MTTNGEPTTAGVSSRSLKRPTDSAEEPAEFAVWFLASPTGQGEDLRSAMRRGIDIDHKTRRRHLEALFAKKTMELQKWWGNPVGGADFDALHQQIRECTEQELKAGIRHAVTQLWFEKWILRPSGIVAAVLMPLFVLYALVRFVKWAWMR